MKLFDHENIFRNYCKWIKAKYGKGVTMSVIYH
jgi:hypothetical protein